MGKPGESVAVTYLKLGKEMAYTVFVSSVVIEANGFALFVAKEYAY